MPELPEVETTLRGVHPHVFQQKVTDVTIRHPRLRWPIPADLKKNSLNHRVDEITRRAKYLLFHFKHGTLILHLGMSGRLRVLPQGTAPEKHDHLDIQFANHKILRFTDPRRFGAVLWTENDPDSHPLLAHLGPEPLTSRLTGRYLFAQSGNRKVAVKSFIMDNSVVVGVGNIYATEALFATSIHPATPANKITEAQYDKLVLAIKKILRQAIKKGGTTLKDFTKSDGTPGYFSIELKAYGHAGEPCPRCGETLLSLRIGQRGTVYCKKCQKQ